MTGRGASLIQLTHKQRMMQLFTAPCLMVINLYGIYKMDAGGERELPTKMKSEAKNEK